MNQCIKRIDLDPNEDGFDKCKKILQEAQDIEMICGDRQGFIRKRQSCLYYFTYLAAINQSKTKLC